MAVVLAGHGVIESYAPAFERLAGGAGLVTEVVAIAHEGVDRAHGVALVAGEQKERVVEVLCAPASYCAAVAVGTIQVIDHAALRKATRAIAPTSRRTRSPREIVGRPESTS